MNLQHINIKFFIENPETVELAKFAGIFNGWIQECALDELLVDVADYLHVHHGPGILLIGHEADYSLDSTAGRLGLLYNRKAQADGANVDKLAQAARSALTAARRLEKDHKLTFDTREVQVLVNDRLLAPNTQETFAGLEPDLKAFFGRLFGGAAYSLEREADARKRFTVTAKTATRRDLDALLKAVAPELESSHA